MKIAIDVDGILVDIHEGILNFCNKKLGTNWKIEDWNKYFLSDCFNITKEEMIKLVDEFFEKGFAFEMPLVKGAFEGIKKLNEEFELNIITARHSDQFKQNDNYFNENFKGINFTNFYLGGNKLYKYKSEICKKENINLIIEDSGDNSLDCAKNGIKVLLLDYPWNQSFSHKNIFRCKNWEEIINKIEELK